MPSTGKYTDKYITRAKTNPGEWVNWARHSTPDRIIDVLLDSNEISTNFNIQAHPIKGHPYYQIQYIKKAPTKTTSWSLNITITDTNQCIIRDETLDITIDAPRLSDAVLLYADAVIPKPKAEDILAAITRNEESA